MDETTQAAIIDALEEMVAEVAPELHGRSMYGGQMLEREGGGRGHSCRGILWLQEPRLA